MTSALQNALYDTFLIVGSGSAALIAAELCHAETDHRNEAVHYRSYVAVCLRYFAVYRRYVTVII